MAGVVQVTCPGCRNVLRIPAEWVQANLVLLIPLMLATPARSYGRSSRRFCGTPVCR